MKREYAHEPPIVSVTQLNPEQCEVLLHENINAESYMYSQKDAGLYGYSMAIGVVIFLFSFALSACVNRATSREPLEF